MARSSSSRDVITPTIHGPREGRFLKRPRQLGSRRSFACLFLASQCSAIAFSRRTWQECRTPGSLVAGVGTIEIRVAFCVRDDPHNETLRKDFSDREADAIDCDGAFADDVMRGLRWKFNFKAMVASVFLKSHNA